VPFPSIAIFFQLLLAGPVQERDGVDHRGFLQTAKFKLGDGAHLIFIEKAARRS